MSVTSGADLPSSRAGADDTDVGDAADANAADAADADAHDADVPGAPADSTGEASTASVRGAARLQRLPAARTTARAAASRAAAQRARILDAAERCFIERGFHAASMAHIAATAGMSPGLIYRYFSAKHEIVRAIVERHLETDGCPAMRRLNRRDDFCVETLHMLERWRRRDDPSMNAALMLELTTEAARDPEIARIVRDKDQKVSHDLALAVQRAAREEGVRLSAPASYMRAVLLQCLVEGLACRVVRDPELSAKGLKPLLSKIIAALME